MASAEQQVKHLFLTEALREPNNVRAVASAMVRMAKAWSLTSIEAASLYGVTLADWNQMKAGTFKGEFDADQMTRVVHLFGIFKGLNMLFNGPLANGWPKRPISANLFNGQSPITSMIEGGLPSIKKVKLHIEALQSGV